MRILHLAYEDPRQPGSGGGAIRTYEINRRLAMRHTITALVSTYAGANPRVEDGIRWRPIGPPLGNKLNRLGYFASLPLAVRRERYDLVVEDFGAPFSVSMSPMYTHGPVIASVQWMFAQEMRRKYHLPFDWVEHNGLRRYSNFIAMSQWLADEIHQRRPSANITVIPNGVDAAAYSTEQMARTQLLFMGRLDIAQKGGDLLFPIYARIRARLGDATPQLVVAGDGPDLAAMMQCAQREGVAAHVQFVGHIRGSERFRQMSMAHAVLMPSRHETFGMVAVEAQATGTPVVTFDVGPLREVCGQGSGVLVPPFDLDKFADATIRLMSNPTERLELATRGIAWSRHYDWNQLAAQQEAAYFEAIANFGSCPQ